MIQERFRLQLRKKQWHLVSFAILGVLGHQRRDRSEILQVDMQNLAPWHRNASQQDKLAQAPTGAWAGALVLPSQQPVMQPRLLPKPKLLLPEHLLQLSVRPSPRTSGTAKQSRLAPLPSTR